jgi:hypothetical protein
MQYNSDIKNRRLKKIEGEEWRIIPGTNERYQVSNYGRIKSFSLNKRDGKILKCSVVNGYNMITISTETGKRRYYTHKLTAHVWLTKPSDDHNYVTHLDGKLKNNHISNLEWHTKESLSKRHQEVALQKSKITGIKIVRNSKLTESDVKLLKSMLARGVVQARIAKLFCISEMQVTRIKRGENWGHV